MEKDLAAIRSGGECEAANNEDNLMDVGCQTMKLDEINFSVTGALQQLRSQNEELSVENGALTRKVRLFVLDKQSFPCCNLIRKNLYEFAARTYGGRSIETSPGQ